MDGTRVPVTLINFCIKMPTPADILKRATVLIITGGSSGIGSALIKATLRLSPEIRVCNLSRSKPDFFLGLDGVHLSTDLADATQLAKSVEAICGILTNTPAGEVILINNSGFGDYGAQFEVNPAKQLRMIDLNARAVVDLTTRLLPEMLKRGGAVINIASTAAFQPTPYLATYGATKAFILNWTLGLNEELQTSRVHAMAVCPGPTRSNFFKEAGFEVSPMQGNKGLNGWLDMTAEQVADYTLKGLAKGKPVVITGWKNNLIAFIGSQTPKVLSVRLGGAILRKMRLERHRGSFRANQSQ